MTETEKEVKIPFSIILKETAAKAVGLHFQQCFILVVGYGNINFNLFNLLQFNGTYNLLLTYILTLIDNNTKE